METDKDPNLLRPALRHSRIGIAAFITGLISLCILMSYLGFIFAFISTSGFGDWGSFSFSIPLTLLVVLIGTLLLGLVTLILSIITFFQKGHKKLFAILAIVELLLTVILMVLSFFSLFLFTGA